MKAILCSRYGTPDDLELADLPDPVPQPGEVAVKVEAAGLNFFDLLIISGKYQFKPQFPFSPSAEFSGVVEGLGAGVTEFSPGDRVMGYVAWGAARERLAVSADKLVKLPTALDFERAAGLSVTYGTSYHALHDRARLKPGETLAVLPEGVMLNYLTRRNAPTRFITWMPPEVIFYGEANMLDALRTAPPAWVLLAWVAAGVLSLAGAMTYAELGAMYPAAGGEYVYLRQGYSPFMGYLFGWNRFWIATPASVAAYAVGSAPFFSTAVPLDRFAVELR